MLSEQAQQLVADFEKQIEALPVEERSAVIKRMTSHISALNDDVKNVFKFMQESKYTSGDGLYRETGRSDANHVRDFI
ncbi:MAG: hypothetical protein WC217_02050 [Candidatus Paceibacterota bacterium]|jgi:hypothetical protein